MTAKAALTTVVLLGVTLVLGTVGTAWRAVHATRERDRAVATEELARTRLESESQALKEAHQAYQPPRAAPHVQRSTLALHEGHRPFDRGEPVGGEVGRDCGIARAVLAPVHRNPTIGQLHIGAFT